MFSKQLITKAVDFLPNNSHDALDNEIINLDLDSRGIHLGKSIPNKKQAIQTYLLSNPNARDNHGDSILLRMMNSVIKKILNDVDRGLDEYDDNKHEFKSDKTFYRYLLMDGYSIDFDKACLIEDIANYTHVAEKNDEIINMLKVYHFDTSLGHYQQAKSSYLGGNYAALTGQLRTFVESIFQDMASYIKRCEPTNPNITKIKDIDATAAMTIFAKCLNPIVDIELNEWDDNKISYFPAFWKRLHPEGSHPGLPELSEAVYRFQIVVVNIEFLIYRFKYEYPLKSSKN